MTCRVIPFPAKPRALTVPTTDLVVRCWAEMAARKIALSMNPNDHNRYQFDLSMTRYKDACDKAGWPA